MMTQAGTRPSDILCAYAPKTGLSDRLVTFSHAGTLRERLAQHPFLMAPMAGVSDGAYRLMAHAGGARLAYSEMVSVAGLHYGGAKTWELVVPQEDEGRIAVQLFGSDSEQFREAATKVAERLGEQLALIDINMACPVPKVTRKGEGSALLDDPERAAAIVHACSQAVDVPVTVKIRSARRTGDREVAVEFSRAMEQAGAAAVAVHGRTASQMYRGDADWGVVTRVVEAVDIPVIGTGDVRSASDAVRMLEQTGATAVMIARGTYGNPWIFSAAESIRAGAVPNDVAATQRLAALCCHVCLLEATGAHLARARSLAGWYLRGIPNAAAWRERAMHCRTVQDYLDLAHIIASQLDGEC